MKTQELVELLRKCHEIVGHEGGANGSGDYCAMVPLLERAFADESIRKAILGYKPPKPKPSQGGDF